MTSRFDWKASRNFCVTTMHCCDFETQECDNARDNGTFEEFVLKDKHTVCGSLQPSSFTLVGYYKTKKNALKAMFAATEVCGVCGFIWNRQGEYVDGN